MQIEPQTLEAIREQIDIVEIISEHVSLKHKNSEHIGLCPFHQEKSPSFTVNLQKGVFYCFGCGEKGDAIAFLMNLNKGSFVETVALLAERYNIPLQQNNRENDPAMILWQEQNRIKHRLLEINQAACKFFEAKRSTSDRAQEYLKSRRIEQATVEKFRLGYSPDEGQALIEALKSKYSIQELVQAGVVKYNEKYDRFYDVFRDRLTVPLFDPQGRVIGFSGRSLSEESCPKYLNTPDTLIFKKSEVIYPLHLARKHIVRQDTAVIVEGNFDVIVLHQTGIEYAIATLGTAITPKVLNRLVGLTQEKTLILGLDNDPAGIKATNRIIDSHLEAIGSDSINFKVLSLPVGFKDVDEVVSTPNGKKTIVRLIEQSSLWVDWRLKQILAEHNFTHADGFNRGRNAIVSLLKQIHDSSLRSFYINEVSKILAGGNGADSDAIALHKKNLTDKTNNDKKDCRINTHETHDKTHNKTLFLKNLSPEQIKVLSCEMLLAKITIFLPEYSPWIVQSLARENWFIRDSLCRWLINRNSWENISDYRAVDLKNQLSKIMDSRLLFAQENEFLNCDYQRDCQAIKAKIDCLFSRSPWGLLNLERPVENIELALNELSLVKVREQIAVAQVMLGAAQTEEEQLLYLQKITQLKSTKN
jgi:DNA primase